MLLLKNNRIISPATGALPVAFYCYPMKTAIYCFLSIAFLSSCGSGGAKKILVMSKGKASVNKEAKTIVVQPGSSHEEQTVEFSGDGSLNLQVTANGSNQSIDIPGDGFYLLNAKTDTIVGSYQNYSAPKAEGSSITLEDLKQRIDSLHQLLAGTNVSTANRNFLIMPGHAEKITDNLDATMVGPFNSLTTLEQTGDKQPEVYKFFTTNDIRETISHLESLTIAPPSPNQ